MSSDILEFNDGEFEGPRVVEEHRHHLEPNELIRIFDVLKSQSPTFWYPFFFVQYAYGCRVSEVRIIKKESVSFSTKEIVIYRLKKRQTDREYVKTKVDAEKLIKRKFPNASMIASSDISYDSWVSGVDEVATVYKHTKKEGFSVNVKNNSRGYKRYLYSLDDAMIAVLNKIQEYHNIHDLDGTQNFLFPAIRKRQAGEKSARMVRIGRLKDSFAISRTNCWRAFRDACAIAGIPESLRKDHVLRHSRATLLLASGVPAEQVQYLLGHESINTTHGYLGLAASMRAKFNITQHNELAAGVFGNTEAAE